MDPTRHLHKAESNLRDERDAANSKLGRLGEEWALAREKQHLAELGRPDLVRHVEWVSDLRGDGLGFDILSRDTDDHELFIEVKTTKLTHHRVRPDAKPQALSATGQGVG